jgi:type IV pilus assembly protein PilW
VKAPGPLRHRRAAARRAAGLTLIELMVAMVIGLVIVLASVAALTVARRGFTTVDAASQLRDSGRFASDLLQRVGVQAGYRDVFVSALLENPAAPRNPAREPNVSGFNNASLDAANPLAAGVARGSGSTGFGSDVMILRYQAPQLYTSLPESTPDPTKAVVSDQTMIDCAGNSIATVTVPGTSAAADDARIASIFHVAINQGEPTLMCTYSPNGAAPWITVPLVQGVENFQVLYGVDGVTPGAALAPAVAASAPDVPHRYLSANQMVVGAAGSLDTKANWRRVRSIRIGMVLRSDAGATQDRDAQEFFPFGRAKGSGSGAPGSAFANNAGDPGTSFSPTPDGRLRQGVTFTIHLRNDQTL